MIRVQITYVPKFREYGIDVEDSSAFQVIDFCPWCGAKLPDSLRDRFFDLIEGMGADDPLDSDLPIDFRRDAWWRVRGI